MMFKTIGNYFQTLWQLVSLQIKNKSTTSFKNNKVSFFIKIFVYLILFSGLTVGAYYLFKLFQDDSIFGVLILPIYFFNFLFITILLFITIAAIYKFTNELFHAPDNQFLLTLPPSKNQLIVSKFIVCYLLGFFRNILLLAPILIAYGALNNLPISFYFWMPFALVFVLLIPLCIAALLSLPVFYIQTLLKKNNLVFNLLIVLLVIGIFIGLLILSTYISKEIRLDEKWETIVLPRLKNFVLTYEKIFYPFYALSMMVLGYSSSLQSPYRLPSPNTTSAMIFGIIIGVVIVVGLINFLLANLFFDSAIASSFEHHKNKDQHYRNYRNKQLCFRGIEVTDHKGHKLSLDALYQFVDEIYESNPFLYEKQKHSVEYYLQFLKTNFPQYRFAFVLLSECKYPVLAFVNKHQYKHLCLFVSRNDRLLQCYNPYASNVKNKYKNHIISLVFKNVLHDARNSSSLFLNLSIVFFPAVIIFAINKIFAGFRLTVLGTELVFTFVFAFELLVLILYASVASSIYSKSQKNAYILNVSPTSKIANIVTNLLHLLIIGFLSILLMGINYRLSTPLNNINTVYLFVTLIIAYVTFLAINAFIDLFSLKHHSFTAQTSEKAGEQNELISFLVSIILVILLAGLGFVFYHFIKEYATGLLMLSSLGLMVTSAIIMFIISFVYKRIEKKERVL